MSTETNKAIARHFGEEVFNKGNTGAIDQLMASNFIEHNVLPPGLPSGREGVKAMMTMLHGAFPDFHATVDDIVAEGDRVVVRSTWDGTQKGEFLGIPASGKHFTIPVIDIMRIGDSKVMEHWSVIDRLGMIEQLGTVPVPGLV